MAATLGGAWAVQASGHPWFAAILASAVAGAAAAALVRPILRIYAGRDPSSGPLVQAKTDLAPSRAARLVELEAQTASLRHDLRGILAPAMLVADRLTESPDPKVAKAGETVVRAVNRAADRLAQTKGLPEPPPPA